MKKVIPICILVLIVLISGCVRENVDIKKQISEDDLVSCMEDSDCKKVPADCCECSRGGHPKSINVTYEDYWNQKISKECADKNTTCEYDVDSYFCYGDAKCINNKCDLSFIPPKAIPSSDEASYQITKGTQKEPSNEGEMYNCKKDDDCISVNANCCGCFSGGKATTINRGYWLYWESQFSTCECTAAISQHWTCTIATPKCINERCELFVPQEVLDTPKGACSRSGGHWVTFIDDCSGSCRAARSNDTLNCTEGLFEGCGCPYGYCSNGKTCEAI